MLFRLGALFDSRPKIPVRKAVSTTHNLVRCLCRPAVAISSRPKVKVSLFLDLGDFPEAVVITVPRMSTTKMCAVTSHIFVVIIRVCNGGGLWEKSSSPEVGANSKNLPNYPWYSFLSFSSPC